MAKMFCVIDTESQKKLLEVSLNTYALRIRCDSEMIRFLKEVGVTDPSTGRRYFVAPRLPNGEKNRLFEAIKAHFQRDLKYQVQDSP